MVLMVFPSSTLPEGSALSRPTNPPAPLLQGVISDRPFDVGIGQPIDLHQFSVKGQRYLFWEARSF